MDNINIFNIQNWLFIALIVTLLVES